MFSRADMWGYTHTYTCIHTHMYEIIYMYNTRIHTYVIHTYIHKYDVHIHR